MPSIVKLHPCETLKEIPMFARPNHIELLLICFAEGSAEIEKLAVLNECTLYLTVQ